MTDLTNVVMLICAAVGSMALGVWLAYAVFRIAFAWMRPRRRAVSVKPQAEVAPSL